MRIAGITRTRGIGLLGLALAALLLPMPGAGTDRTPPLRVLFVGNSYLYVNDLPAQVRRMAATRGIALDATMLAEPDFGLADHLRDRKFLRALEQDWDWIVLQQGPSSLLASREDLRGSVRDIVARLRGKPAKVALLSGWPAKPYIAYSRQGEESYHVVAVEVGACVLPVASAWRIAGEAEHPPRLYAEDALHATRTGTRLAAMTVVHGLLGREQATEAEGHETKRDAALAGAVERAYQSEAAGCTPS